MKVVIIEDETAAAVNLTSLISKLYPEIEIVATLESVTDTIEWIASNPPADLLFMDIHLADGDAFRIFDSATITSPIIFTTAYDQYALEAFKVNSIDYILKPIKPDDLRRAIDKFRHLTGRERESYAGRVMEMTEKNSSSLLVHIKDKIIPVKPEEISFIYTFDEKITIFTTDNRELPYDKSLERIISKLSSESFFRANRQFIISRKSIKDISVWFGSRLAVNMDHPTPGKIIISKARVPVFKKWLAGASE